MKTKKIIFISSIALLLVILLLGLSNSRTFGKPNSEMDNYFIKNGQKETGANNIVTSVVFDYRGFDTLGEASVLFAAVLGVAVLFDLKITKQKIEQKKMSRIVRTIAKLVFFFTALFGLLTIIKGHLTPGGGFQGGAIIASGFALLTVSFGYIVIGKHREQFDLLESIGLLLFIALAFVGIKIAFFNNFLAQPMAYGPNPGFLISGGLIPLMNIAVGAEVLAALTIIIVLMSKADFIK